MIGENLKSMLDEIKKQRIKVYSILTFPLDAARSDFELTITGTYFYVLSQTGIASIKFNEMFSDSIDIIKNRSIIVPFYRIYLTNTAQSGLSMTVAIGVSSDVFSISDYSAPEVSIMSGYILQIRDSFAYNYGTQIAKSNAVQNSTVVIHTVATGKTFLLEHYNVSTYTSGAGSGRLFITDAADAEQYRINSLSFGAAGSIISQANCVISIPTGWKIKILSDAAALTINAFIKGREI